MSKESLDLASKDPSLNMKAGGQDDANGGSKEEKIVTGKDLRRVVATNLPLDFGLNQEDLGIYIIMKCREKGDEVTFRSIFLNTEQNSGVVECMDKEMTDMVIKLDGEVLLGHTLRFTKVADETGFIHGGDCDNLLQDSAQLTAQAAAIVSSRIRGLQGKNGGASLNLNGDETDADKISQIFSLFTDTTSFASIKPSRIVKISNVFDRYSTMSAQQFEDLYEDMDEEMSQHGQYKRIKIIRNGEEKIGGNFLNFPFLI